MTLLPEVAAADGAVPDGALFLFVDCADADAATGIVLLAPPGETDPANMSALLELQKCTVRFGGLTAVSELT